MSPTQDQQKPAKAAKPAIVPAEKSKPTQLDDDVVGKVYDSRLMARLLVYLSPY
jgi:ATP-binding cassette subfamily B protein